MKNTIRLTESELIRLVKRIIKEEECSAPPQWLMDFQLDGKLGKSDCSNWEWRKDTYTFLWVSPKDKILILSISPNEIEEEQLNELKQIFGNPKITEKYYTFKYNFSNSEEGGDLNQTLDRLQGKIPFISSINESRFFKNVIKEDDDYSMGFKRRMSLVDDIIIDLISDAKDEVDEDDFDNYFEYLENIIYWVVQVLQTKYGEMDDFWYDNEDEIIDYIKDKYDDYLE